MHRQPQNAIQKAARWGGKALNAVNFLALVYDRLVTIASVVVPPGTTRRKVAKRLQCEARSVPDALVHYAAIYGLAVVIILLGLQALVAIFVD